VAFSPILSALIRVDEQPTFTAQKKETASSPDDAVSRLIESSMAHGVAAGMPL